MKFANRDFCGCKSIVNPLTDSNEKYRLVAENVSSAVLIINQHREVIFWNAAAERITGITRHDILGSRGNAWFARLDRALRYKGLRCLKKGTSFEIERFRDDHEMTGKIFHLAGYNVADELVVIFENITPRLQAEEQMSALSDRLQRARKDLQQIETLKSQFIDNVTHELRTPLSAILAYIELFEDGITGLLSTEQHEILNEIRHETNRLHEHIENLLELTQIQAGKSVCNFSPCYFPDLLEHVIKVMTPFAQEKGLRMSVNCASDLPLIALDWRKIRRVFINLLHNAIKFTEYGQIDVYVRQDADSLEVRICDTGIGIPPEELDIITEQFRQVDGSMIREHGGMGVGLTVAARLLTMHQATLNVFSTPGKGSCFSFTLPNESPLIP